MMNTDAEAEAPILWPPNAESRLTLILKRALTFPSDSRISIPLGDVLTGIFNFLSLTHYLLQWMLHLAVCWNQLANSQTLAPTLGNGCSLGIWTVDIPSNINMQQI